MTLAFTTAHVDLIAIVAMCTGQCSGKRTQSIAVVFQIDAVELTGIEVLH
eukprot:TRINITY_DN7710_c0_g1_i1.p6 TRINITY_DN7710_c0_g1~~TRINITY_DN7710_c0_g1_i1.p6  ORF type:complete len:50 (+),score=10.09 TRINITY_DN7710_c0_g1_i1:190-339(+)